MYISGAYEPKQDRLQDIAIALGVDIAWLMGYDTSMTPMKEKKSPSDITLSEGEKTLVDLFRLIPEEKQQAFLEMGRLYASTLKKD